MASSFSYRTHTCGELRAADVGRSVVLLGWVHRVRNLGGLRFFDLRDRYGLTQVVVRESGVAGDDVTKVRSEFVVAVEGKVDRRGAEAVNSKLDTGEIEVVASSVRILNDAKTPPFVLNEEALAAEELRLRYRY